MCILKGCCQYKSNHIHDLLLNVDLWHATSWISLLKWELWGKFDFVCELWILEGKEAENIYEHFGLQCAVLVLNTACVIPGGYEQMNRLLRNNIKGELSIWSKERQTCASWYARACVWHTPQSSLTNSDLWQHVYWPGPLLLWFVCLQLSRNKVPSALFPVPSCCLTLKRNVHSSHCYQTLAVLVP